MSRRRRAARPMPSDPPPLITRRELEQSMGLTTAERDRRGRLLRRYHEVKIGPRGALYYEIKKQRPDGSVTIRKKYLTRRQVTRCFAGVLPHRGGVCEEANRTRARTQTQARSRSRGRR